MRDPILAAWIASFDSHKTRLSYTDCLHHFELALRGVPVREASASQVTEAVRLWERERRSCSPRTYNQFLSVIRSAYRHLIAEDVILKDPTRLLGQRSIPETSQPRPSVAEVAKIWELLFDDASYQRCTYEMQTLRLRDRAIFALLITTGLRNVEVCNLNVKDFDLDRRIVTARTKGGKIQQKVWPIQISPTIIAHLQQKTGAAFLSATGTRLSIYDMNNMLKRVCVAARVKYYSAHCYRRYFMDAARAGGVPLADIQLGAGHSNLNTTGNYFEKQRRVDIGGHALPKESK